MQFLNTVYVIQFAHVHNVMIAFAICLRTQLQSLIAFVTLVIQKAPGEAWSDCADVQDDLMICVCSAHML